MDHRFLTLTLFISSLPLIASFLSSAVPSPSPAPSPRHVIFDLPTHSLPISPRHRQRSPPLLSSGFRYRLPRLPPPPSGKLNLGKKLGLLFASIAIVLQVPFAVFLIYKRWQLMKMVRRCRPSASS